MSVLRKLSVDCHIKGDKMYRVWCWKYGVLELYNCGSNVDSALNLLISYFNPPNYLSYLEYVKEEGRK